MAANYSKSYLIYLNKLVDQYNNTYHQSINTDYPALTEKITINLKTLQLKVNDRVRIAKCKNIFTKGYTESWLETYLLLILF